MNEKQFLRRIKSTNNIDGVMTSKVILELLDEEQSDTNSNLFARLFNRRHKAKSARQIIEENFEYILNNSSDENLRYVLSLLVSDNIGFEIIKARFDEILGRLSKVQDEIDIENNSRQLNNGTRSIIIEHLRKKAPEILIANMNAIIEGGVSFKDIENLRGLLEEADEKLNERLNVDKEEIARELLQTIGVLRNTDKKVLVKDYATTLSIIIDELLKSENARMIDITVTGNGITSVVYQIGNKVLKIGKPRVTYQIPNHPRILQPLTRTNLINEKCDNKILACIEVSDRVDKVSDEVDSETLYQIYRELRESGIIWTDAKIENIGRLRNKNVPNLNGEEIDVDPQAVGLHNENNEETLGVGELVITDTDCIYGEKEQDIVWCRFSKSEEFETRWQQEMQSKIAEKYRKEADKIGRDLSGPSGR